jgi:hypothetical protein
LFFLFDVLERQKIESIHLLGDLSRLPNIARSELGEKRKKRRPFECSASGSQSASSKVTGVVGGRLRRKEGAF